MSETMRGRAAVAGIGETAYYKRGQAPDAEFKLALDAIKTACADAGIDAKDVDGFASYSNDRSDPSHLAAALGCKELRFANMQWGGGGGGGSGAVANAAAAIHAGLADTVVVFRALAQGQFGRFGQGPRRNTIAGDMAYSVPYGLMSPAQMFAMKVVRFMHDHGVEQSALRAISLACYEHAQANPRAVMYGRPLDEKTYDESRWIVEPFHLYDCCMENDGAAAMIIMSTPRAKELRDSPVLVLGAQMSGGHRSGAWVHNQTDYATSSFKPAAKHMYDQAGVTPADVDVVQSYENFTGGVLMSLIEHGLCDYSDANEVLTFRADGGGLPLNTSGGNLAECYMHGLGLQIEAVRQVRGDSSNQVDDVKVSLANAGPMVEIASTAIYGSEEALG